MRRLIDSDPENLRMVEETFLRDNSVSRLAHMHGVTLNQLFGWRRQAVSGALTATRAGGEVVYRMLENQVRERRRMLGKTTMENEILREAISRVAVAKYAVAHAIVARGRPVSAAASKLGLSRQDLSATRRKAPARRRDRPPLPEEEFVEPIHALIDNPPTYGFRRIHALLRRQSRNGGPSATITKRIDRMLKVHGPLLQRHSGKGERAAPRRARVAADTRNNPLVL
jgi:transposase-like protein